MTLHDEVDIEDMDWNEELQAFTYQCPCGDLFQISMDDLAAGEDIARCPSCSLYITTKHKATRHTEAAFKVKSRVIEAIIDSYKSINDNQVETAWRISGTTVIQEFHMGTAFERQYEGWEGYNHAWSAAVQATADAIQTYNGTLFFKGMNGGISDIESGQIL